jgi:serine/threonine protein kinase
MTVNFEIPGYDIKRELGRGGMAVVYLAIQQSFGREVALKILPREQAEDADFAERFLREARIVSQLIHPNIVTVYDVGVHEGYRYLSMEYIHGLDLKQAHASLSRRDLLSAIKDVARALDYAASKGYVHRDVKPENIMIREEDGRVVLMDFGIARGGSTTLNMTRAGKAIGTPYYMSPEQTKGQSVDHRSDIYSLGVVLYQMLAGYVPYDADSAVAVGIKHLTAPIPLLPDSLRILQPIINTAMAKDPEHRFQTAGEMIEALDKISDDDLAALDAGTEAFRLAGKDHAAITIQTPVLTGNSVPPIVAPHHTAITSPKTTAVDKTLPRRRRGLLLLLLITITGLALYVQREPLQKLWHTWQPVLATRLGVSPNHPPARTPSDTPQTSAPERAATTQSPSAGSNLPPVTRREQINQLRNTLDENPDNAVKLAQLYRQILRNHNQNVLARRGLIQLLEWYTQQFRIAMAAGELARARSLVDGLKQSFPRAANSEKIVQLEERLNRAEAVETHLRRAREYFTQHALTEPEGANALEEIQAALAIDPDSGPAHTAHQQIIDASIAQARKQQTGGNYKLAMLAVEQGLKAEPENHELLDLQKEINNQIRQQAKVADLLQQASKQMQQHHLLEPKSTSALALYRNVLKLEPGNLTASDGLKQIEQQLLGGVSTAMANGDLELASNQLATISSHFGNSQAVHKIQTQLDKAIEAQRPRIDRLRLSASPIENLDGPQPDSLQLSRSLYVGFEYANFDPENTLLQAVLSDGSGAVKFAQKPVVVSGETGTVFFDLQLPVEGFTGGSYKLELFLENTPLASSPFLVR